MTKKLATFTRELTTGITPSLPELETPFFVDGANVIFGGDGVEVQQSWFKLLNKIDDKTVRGIISARVNVTNWLFWGTPENLYKWNGSGTAVSASGTTFTGRENATAIELATHWSLDTLEIDGLVIVIATNGEDAPVESIDNVDFTTMTITGSSGVKFAKAEIMRLVGSRIVALNTSNGDRMVEWSDDLDRSDWDETNPNNTAGELPFRDCIGPIIAAEPFGGQGLLVYSSGSIHLLSNAGPAFILGQRRVITGVGAVSKNAVVSANNRHYVFDKTGIYVTDGNSYTWIDNPVIRKHIFGEIDLTQISKVVGWFNVAKQEVQWFYPRKNGDTPVGVGYRTNNNTWTIYAYSMSAAHGQSVFGFPINGLDNGDMLQLDINVLGGGVNLLGAAMKLPATIVVKQGFGTGGYGKFGFGGRIGDG